MGIAGHWRQRASISINSREIALAFKIYFSDFFSVAPEKIEEYGAFNISLINDLPLFVDPFLLFSSEKQEYQDLHTSIIDYVKFLKRKSAHELPTGAIKAWFHFPEIKENWFGYSKIGNSGRGLGGKFASSLKTNLVSVFKDFGEEEKTGSHLGKLTLVRHGVGRDQVSDFTCNLIAGYLAEYTEKFAKEHIDAKKLAKFVVPKVRFDYKTETWASKEFTLPKFGKEFVLLSPVDMLSKDEAWISHKEMVEDFSRVRASVANDQLRAQIDNYFASVLPFEPSKEQVEVAVEKTVQKYPEILDSYILLKESAPREALEASAQKVQAAQALFVRHLTKLVEVLANQTAFYKTATNSLEEGMARVNFLKHVIEKQDGYKLFYLDGKPVRQERDLQIMFKLTWFASDFDSNAEVNNGRGPSDFMVSYGSSDKVAIEFKLARSSQLEKNLLKQAEIYSDAARATHPPIKAILYFTDRELSKVQGLLAKHKLMQKKEIVLIDARPKDSASKAD